MASSVPQSRIPIAQLNPELESADDSSVHGIVTLIWPYNSLTRSLSLLLVEPDFRLRRNQGQVRIQFLGSSAQAVTKAGVSSGDELALSLQGASWKRDVETANTPGRGIAWRVTFGERVVLEARHPGQASRLLDIDHPLPLSEPSQQASSPSSSPLYNSHIPTSNGKPKLAASNDNYPTWSSPAFLKRSRLALSSYDPFAELDDEFADNNRKKKTKFGRGSGQWKFVENEPSPERECDDVTHTGLLSSPSRNMQMETQENEKGVTMLATPPAEDPASVIEEMPSVSGAPGSSHLNETILTNGVGSTDTYAGSQAMKVDSTPGDQLPLVHKEQPAEPGSDNEKTNSSARSAKRVTVSSPSERASSPQSSPPDSQKEDRSLTSGLEFGKTDASARERERHAFWGESSLQFGMDGATISKLHQAAKITPMANEIGRRWVEMQRRASKPDVTVATSQESGSRSAASLPDRPALERFDDSRETSSISQAHAPPDSEGLVPPENRSIEAIPTPQDQPQGENTDGDDESSERIEGEDADQIAIVDSTRERGAEQATMTSHIEIPDTTGLDRREVEDISISHGTTRAQPTVDSDVDDQENHSHAKIPEPATSDEPLAKTSLASQEDKDTGTDERLRGGRDSVGPADDEFDHPFTNTVSDQRTPPTYYADDSASQLKQGQQDSNIEVIDISSGESESEISEDDFDQASVLDDSALDDGPLSQEENDLLVEDNFQFDHDQIYDSAAPAEALHEDILSGDSDEEDVLSGDSDDEMDNAEVLSNPIPQDTALDPEILPSQLPLPSTIQDTLESSSANQLFTANDAQQVDLFSQASAPQFSFTEGSATIAEPRLGHEIANSIIVLGDPRFIESIDEEVNRYEFSAVAATQESASLHDVQEDSLDTLDAKKPKEFESNELGEPESDIEIVEPEAESAELVSDIDIAEPKPEIAEPELEIAEPKPESAERDPEPDSVDPEPKIAIADDEGKQSSYAQPSGEENTAPSRDKERKDERRSSSLISRVKEMRQQSGRAAKGRLSSGSANPWFTPRSPSPQVNDDQETDNISKPIEQLKIIAAKKSSGTTPEKVDMRLSQSFIRSSPQQSPDPQSTLPEEVQYIPSSQQNSGLRTDLSYFVPVTSLHCHFGTSVDILAVAIASTPVTRAPSGPKDHTQTIYFTDPSSTSSKKPNSLTAAQIFRPYRARKGAVDCFPSVQAGDAILLRDFKVQSFQRSLSIISTDSSAWAVFRKDADVAIPGPPVEYGPEERAFARGLWEWWASLDPAKSTALIAAVPKPKKSSPKKSPAKKGLGFDIAPSQSKKSEKKGGSSDDRIPVSLRERSTGLKSSPEPDTHSNRVAKAGKPAPQQRRVLRPRKGRSVASASPEPDAVPSEDEIHELRDGTRYVDREVPDTEESDRVLRPRKAKSRASATPDRDALPVVEEIHELRDGTRYVDREGVEVEEVEMVNGVHDLRDGTRYRDRLRK